MSEWARQVPVPSCAKGGGILQALWRCALPPDSKLNSPKDVHEARGSAFSFLSNQAPLSLLFPARGR